MDRMAKGETEPRDRDMSRVYLQVDRQGYGTNTIDMVNVVTNMGRHKKLFFYLTALAACAGILLGVLISAACAVMGISAGASAVVSFSFEGIDQGLAPNGGAFDVTKIKSTPVINKALAELGWEEVPVEEIREGMKIEGIIPDGVKQKIAVINTVAEDAAEYYANIEDIDYFPSQYTVTLRKCAGLSGDRTRELLDAILASYREYFMDAYANTEVLSASFNVLNFETYDYRQAADMLENEMMVMKSYVDDKKEEDAGFRAASTGFSFGDLSSSIDTLINLDLANFTSFVQSHNLTKDAGTRADYYNYQINQYTLQISELQAQLSTVQTTIQSYQKDPVIVMSTQEAVTETSQKNEFYDSLLERKLELTEKIGQLNTELERTYELLESLADSTVSGSEEEYTYADTLLSNLLETVRTWSELVQATADEYYSTELFADAYRISVPAQYSAAGSLGDAAKNMAVCAGILVAMVMVVWSVAGVKEEVAKGREDGHS